MHRNLQKKRILPVLLDVLVNHVPSVNSYDQRLD